MRLKSLFSTPLLLFLAAMTLGQIFAVAFAIDSWPFTNYPMFTQPIESQVTAYKFKVTDARGGIHWFEEFSKVAIEIYEFSIHQNHPEAMEGLVQAQYQRLSSSLPQGAKEFALVQVSRSGSDLTESVLYTIKIEK